jgi:nucleotide-binding universal stress UspA family protein
MVRVAMLSYWHVHAKDYTRQAQEHPDLDIVALHGASIDENAEITLMHVVETPWMNIGLERDWLAESRASKLEHREELQIERELESEGEAVLDSARELLTRQGMSVSTIIEEGNPATEILGQAEAADYDLILLGTTGASDVKHEMLGSVSAKVAGQSPCSVVVVKEW